MVPEDLERRPPAESRRERSLTWIGDRRADFDRVPRGGTRYNRISLQASCFGAICIHLLTGAGPVFIELVDDQRGVPVYHDAFNAELNVYTESVETCFIFGGIVGGRKMYPENVSELILGRVMNRMPAPSPLMLRAPSKYITQCSGQVAAMGS